MIWVFFVVLAIIRMHANEGAQKALEAAKVVLRKSKTTEATTTAAVKETSNDNRGVEVSSHTTDVDPVHIQPEI